MDLKGIFSGVSEKVTGAIGSVKTSIAESKNTETSSTSKLPSIKEAVDKVKETISATVEIHELRDLDLNGWKTNSLLFFCDTKNPVTTLMAPGTMYNSELQMIIDSSEKKAIGFPNEYMFYMSSEFKGIYSVAQLKSLEKYFEFTEQDTEDALNLDDNFLYTISKPYPAKFKLDGEYYKLTEKGKLVLVPFIEDDDDYIIYDDELEHECEPEIRTTTETVSELEVEAATETASEPEVEAATETASEPEVEAATETASEPKVEADTETVSEPEVEAATETVSEPEVEAATETASEPEVETATETVSEPKVEAATETVSEPEIKTATAKTRRKRTTKTPNNSSKNSN